MNTRLLRCAVLAGLALPAAAGTARAQQPVVLAPVPVARHVAGGLRLDGAPDEAAWQMADSIGDFTQRDPDEGRPGSERTVVRLLTTDAGLWIAFWNYDRDPAGIRHTQLRRDADLDFDDHVAVLIDAQRDRRSGFVFGTNANGALYDAEIVNAENTNEDWNGVWDARARIVSYGWTAELFIPWQNLRYEGDTRSFGLNIVRFVRRRNEEQLWRGWLRQQGFLFQEEEGALEIEGRLPHRQTLEGRPYIAGTVDADTRTIDSTGAWVVAAQGGASAKAGMDAKIAVAPTLTLDLTVNTDFAQVEADRQVVNLTRFPVFFPEKRQFFLEAASLFDLGQAERTQLFHSRRIGLDDNGNVVPILAGARLTGRVGHERIGLLAARTGGNDLAREDALDLVGRIQHDVFSRGYVGAMGTFQGGPGIDGQHLGGGLDFNLPLLLNEQNIVPSGFVAVTRNADGQPWASAWRLFLDYPNDWADNFLGVSRIEEGFDPALGFVQQTGVQRVTGAARFMPRPHRWGVRQLVFKPIEFDINWHLDGSLDHAFYEIRPLGAEFESGDLFEFNIIHRDDVPADTFDIFDGILIPAGRYGWNRGELTIESSSARPVGAEVSVSAGQFYDGHSEEFSYDVSVRLEPHVIAGVDGGWEWVRLPGGSFTAQAHRVRLDYATNPRLNTTLFLQWDSESNRLAVNARLHWIPSPGSDAYLVWNTTWPTALSGGIPWRQPQRGALVGKFVYYFRM